MNLFKCEFIYPASPAGKHMVTQHWSGFSPTRFMCCTTESSKTRMFPFVLFWEIWWNFKWLQCPGTSLLNIFAEYEEALPSGQVIELGIEHFRKALLRPTAWVCSFIRFYFRNCSIKTSENTLVINVLTQNSFSICI